MSVLKIQNENFEEEVLNSKEPVIVDFYADWCGPCKIMSPIMDELSNEKDNIKVCKINVDENQELSVKFGIMSIPTIIIFKNGNIVKKFIGVVSKEELLNGI